MGSRDETVVANTGVRGEARHELARPGQTTGDPGLESIRPTRWPRTQGIRT
jgi:hypothetical protein